MNQEYFKKTLKHPKKANLEVEFIAHNEQLDFKDGHFSEQADIDYIENQLNKGNQAAWFTAEIKVKLKGTNIEISEYLGCCSYKTFDDFIESNDYYSDMVETATNELNEQCLSTFDTLRKYLNIK